jgi:hypothetical protein
MAAGRACCPSAGEQREKLVQVTLNGKATSLTSKRGRAFVADCAKAVSKQLAPRDLLKTYGLTAEAFKSYFSDDSFFEAVRAERDRHASNRDVHERSPKSARGRRNGAAIGQKRTVVKPPTSSFADDVELVEDLARYAEGVLSEKEVRKRHRLNEKAWLAMGEDDLLCERIDDRRIRRVRDGSTKRELAQKHVVRGPAVLAGIMDDPGTHAKHKIDSIRALDHLAANGPQAAGDGSMFNIVINLGADADGREIIETYNKPRKIGVSDDNTIIDNIGE